jgi:hypothetical protein
MKHANLTLTAFLVLFTITSCKNKTYSPTEEYLRPASMQYTKADTNSIESLVNQYAEFIKNKDFDNAARMLYEVHHDSIKPLSAEKRLGFINAYSNMPIYASRLNNFTLRSDKNNQIDILVQIIKDGNLDKGIGVTKISLNPVTKKGQWYLTLLDKNAEGVKDVYNPNQQGSN